MSLFKQNRGSVQMEAWAEDQTSAIGTEPDSAAVELTVLMPCLNEAETLERCIQKAQQFLFAHSVRGEVLIADNGSTDGSRAIAEKCGARVVSVSERGYGAALRAGIAAARGEYTIMGDADDSYDFSALMPFLVGLRGGSELVVGNRFTGGISPGAMPPLHKYLGNPVLSRIGTTLFRTPVGDFHCGLRGFQTSAMRELRLDTSGMEFASEMIVRSSLAGLNISEVPTTLSPDGRSRPPHLRSWRDGWRHLRFLLAYSPSWLFFYPGFALMLVGLVGTLFLATGERSMWHFVLGIHSLLYAAFGIIVGFELVHFGRFVSFIGVRSGVLPEGSLGRRIEGWLTLEVGLVLGLLLILLGIAGSLVAVGDWMRTGLGDLQPQNVMRLTIPSVTAAVLGVQMVSSSFLMYALRMGPGRDR